VLLFLVILLYHQLYYHSKSSSKPAGQGCNETAIDYTIYNELNKIKDWRKILSNFYISNLHMIIKYIIR
jgi:hypothetical protein